MAAAVPAEVPPAIRARAIQVLADALRAAQGRRRLSPAQYLTLIRAYLELRPR